jgi:hypothetical protein
VIHDAMITLRIFIALDQVEWYNNGMAFMLLNAKRVIPYTLKFSENHQVVDGNTSPNSVHDVIIRHTATRSNITIALSHLLNCFMLTIQKYQHAQT